METEKKEVLQKTKEVLGQFPHLTTSGPRIVALRDIAHNDLIIEDDKGNNISSQDYVKDESKSTKEKAVFVRLDDSQATIKSIVENKSVWVPIHITPRSPTKTQPQPYKIIDGRTRAEGAHKAELHDIPAIIWEGFRNADETKVLGILLNTTRRSVTDQYRTACLHQLIVYEEEQLKAGKQDYRSSFNRLATLAGYQKGGNETVCQYEKSNWYGRFVAYDSGREKRLGADNRPMKIRSPRQATERWTPEQVFSHFRIKIQKSEVYDVTETVLREAKAKFKEYKDSDHTKDPKWERHTLPKHTDALEAADAYHRMWADSETKEPPKDRTEAKTDPPKKAHGKAAAEKAKERAEKAKDQDDSKDQTGGAAKNSQDQNETSGQTSPSGTTVTVSPNAYLFKLFGDDLVEAEAWLDGCPSPKDPEWQTKLHKVGYAVALWFRWLVNTSKLTVREVAQQCDLSEEQAAKLDSYADRATQLMTAMGKSVK